MFNGTSEMEPAIFASNCCRSQLQMVTTVWPCSGTGSHLNQSFARFPRSFGSIVERMSIGEVLGGGVIQLPNQCFLPIRPIFVARALAVNQREQHQGIEIILVFD